MTGTQVRGFVARSLRVPVDKIYVSDGSYLAYSIDALGKFLRADSTNTIKYQSEKFDCDDFARVLVGREREWFLQHQQQNRGSTLGICWGDIRNSEQDTTPRPHAVNFFIDSNQDFWLVEPQTDHFFKPTSNSSFFFACV